MRDGIVSHSGRAAEPATLEGAIVRITDRFAYLNHDIDDALRAGRARPRAICRASAIAVLGETGAARIDTLVHDLVEHSEAAGEIVQGEAAAARCPRCATSCSTRVYLGRWRPASTPRSSA